MAVNNDKPIDINEIQPSFSLSSFILILVAALVGAMAALYVLPNWLPGLTDSIAASDPKAFWFLSRGSAFAAFFLLWLSMIFGVGITNKLAVIWPGLPPAIDLHQFVSILGNAFVIFHGLILIGDKYINYTFFQILLPFSTIGYKPVLVGLGQVGVYLWLLLVISFYIRKKIGSRAWRFIHFSSFLLFVFALIHGITTGTDTNTLWAQIIYWSTGFVFLVLVIYRIIFSSVRALEKKKKLQQM